MKKVIKALFLATILYCGAHAHQNPVNFKNLLDTTMQLAGELELMADDASDYYLHDIIVGKLVRVWATAHGYTQDGEPLLAEDKEYLMQLLDRMASVHIADYNRSWYGALPQQLWHALLQDVASCSVGL